MGLFKAFDDRMQDTAWGCKANNSSLLHGCCLRVFKLMPSWLRWCWFVKQKQALCYLCSCWIRACFSQSCKQACQGKHRSSSCGIFTSLHVWSKHREDSSNLMTWNDQFSCLVQSSCGILSTKLIDTACELGRAGTSTAVVPPCMRLKLRDCQENTNPLGKCFPYTHLACWRWGSWSDSDPSHRRLALRLPADESFSAPSVKSPNPLFLRNLILKLNLAAQFEQHDRLTQLNEFCDSHTC